MKLRRWACGAALPLRVRIVAVVDTFDAMTAEGSYNQLRTVEQAQAALEAGTQRDPEVVKAILAVLADVLPARERAIGQAPTPLGTPEKYLEAWLQTFCTVGTQFPAAWPAYVFIRCM